jgi:two-component system cell cycle response regulator CpdR
VLRQRSETDALGTIADDPSIEVLITDINMPGLNGAQLAQRARSFRPRLDVILVSGHASDTYGFPFIRKPFLKSDLQRAMAETNRSH